MIVCRLVLMVVHIAPGGRLVRQLSSAFNFPVLNFQGHVATVFGVTWSPDSQFVASSSYDDDQSLKGLVIVWRSATGQEIVRYHGHETYVLRVNWAPTRQLVASYGWDEQVHTWDPLTGECQCIYQGPDAMISGLAWSSTSMELCAGDSHAVYLWKTGKPEPQGIYLQDEAPIQCVSWAPDNRWLAIGTNDEVLIWEPLTGIIRARLGSSGHHPLSVIWSPDGERVASVGSDGTARVWQVTTGKEVVRYLEHITPYAGSTMMLWSIAWSPDGRYLATGDGEIYPSTPQSLSSYKLHIWESRTGVRVATYSGHVGEIRSVAWSPDGSQIATGSADTTVCIWQVYKRSSSE